MKKELSKHNHLTVAEVSEYLNVSPSKVYELSHRKDFPVCRMGRTIRIPREPFMAWVEKCTSIPPALAVYMRTKGGAA